MLLSPRQNVVDGALVPEFRLLTLKFPLILTGAKSKVEEISANDGWVAAGTPAVEIVLSHLCETAAMYLIPPKLLELGLGKSPPTQSTECGSGCRTASRPCPHEISQLCL